MPQLQGKERVAGFNRLRQDQEWTIHEMAKVWRKKHLPLAERRRRIQRIGRANLARTQTLMVDLGIESEQEDET